MISIMGRGNLRTGISKRLSIVTNSNFRRPSVSSQIENDLREKVRTGHWAPGIMLPSRRALAEQYGANLNTIQRAIDRLVADGVLRTEGGRGTFVAEAVETPTTKPASIKTIAAILDLTYNPSSPSAMATPQAIYQTVRREKSDYRVLIFDTHGATGEKVLEQERHALSVVENEGVSGAILRTDSSGRALPFVRKVMDRGIPIVFIDRYPGDFDCDFVGSDNAGGALLAVEHLAGLGHKQVAHLTTDEPITTVKERHAGYVRGMSRAGGTLEDDLVWRVPLSLYRDHALVERNVEGALTHFLDRADSVTAVFALNDYLAYTLIGALERRGGSVPGTLSVVGFDDLDRFSSSPAMLTTVQQPFEDIATQATELLLSRLENSAVNHRTYRHITLPTRLILRASTAAPQA